MSDKSLILSSLASRGKNYGISTAAQYLKALDGCFEGGLCPRHMRDVSGEQWAAVLKEAEQKLTYSTRGMNLDHKSVADSSLSGFMLEFDCVVTSTQKDRDGDILETSGASLDPMAPLLWQHNPMFPLGRCLRQLSKTNSKMTAKCGIADFADGDGELAKMARDAVILVRSNCLRISHGFDPRAFEPLEQKDGRWRVTSFEVLEISLVSIPSNTSAIIENFSRGKLHSAVIKGWAKNYFDSRPAQGRGISFDLPETPEKVLVNGITFAPEKHDCRCHEKSESYRHEGESAEDCVSRKIEVNRRENPDMSQEQAAAIAYSECHAKDHQTVTEPKDNSMSTKEMPASGPTPPTHPAAEDERFLGQGPQDGDPGFEQTHAANEVEPEDLTGVDSFELNNSGDDETLSLATNSGKRNPQDPMNLLPEGEDLSKQGAATTTAAKDVGVVEPMHGDEASHHDLNGAVDGRIHLEKAVRDAAMKIRHSGNEGAVYLNHETKAVHHVAHESDLHPANGMLYDNVAAIRKAYASASPMVKAVHVAMHHPAMGSGYKMVHAGGPQGTLDGKSKTLTKVGRVLSAKNMKRLTEATKHLEHVGTMGDSHVSSIAMPHLKLAHAHVAEVVKEANSLDPNGEGVYAESKVPPDDAANPGNAQNFQGIPENASNPGNAPHFNTEPPRDDPNPATVNGFRGRIDPDTIMQVTRPNIPGSVSIEDLLVKTMLSLDLADRESIAALKTACEEELNHRKSSDADFLEEMLAHASLES